MTLTEESASISINQAALGYGDRCLYILNGTCGYPSFNFTGENIDLVMAYNTTLWRNFTAYDSRRQTWNEINALAAEMNKAAVWTMPNGLKSDTFNITTNQTDCENTITFVVLTNLRNHGKPVTERQLQVETKDTTVFTYVALPQGAMSASYLFTGVIACLSALALLF